MTFEEFFKKKRIDLVAFERGDLALFSEFKIHFERMGEKSFDHTKKYWFNKLRRQFVLAPEIKTEKPKIDNPLAEQTITEALDEMRTSPSLGFKPKFRAAAAPQPAADKPEETKAETPATASPKPGFTPRFKAGITPKPAVEQSEETKPETIAADAPKTGFTPRFKAGITKPAAEQPDATEPQTPAAPAPKLGFTPKFKAANMPKPMVEQPDNKEPEKPAPVEDTPVAAADTETPKPAYKPRFNMKNIPKKD